MINQEDIQREWCHSGYCECYGIADVGYSDGVAVLDLDQED